MLYMYYVYNIHNYIHTCYCGIYNYTNMILWPTFLEKIPMKK